jgi:3-oxoacyl-[acyl-carrier-protein] synthase II
VIRAVITGVGAVSAFGFGIEALWNGLARGACAISEIRSFDAAAFPTRMAGEVPMRSNPTELLGDRIRLERDVRPLIARWAADGTLRDRKTTFAALAAAEAWESAHAGPSEKAASLSLASGLEQCFLEDFASLFRDGRIDWEADRAASLPTIRFRSPAELPARCLSELFELEGRTIVNASACAAGTLAVAHAAALVERGTAPVVLCGGTDSLVNPIALGGMSRIGAPSPRAERDACRPFDRRRDGLVIGEGAAMFVVESEERARARGVRPLARILGWGSSGDAHRPTAPLPDGSAAARAMERALARARLSARDVGYVNAHGTGTLLNDPAEARAIRKALGGPADRTPVSSIKGAVGHLMVASGAIELAASLLAFERDLLPGTANHRERDPECEIDVIGETPRPATVDVVLKNSFGFGGQNASLVLGRVR